MTAAARSTPPLALVPEATQPPQLAHLFQGSSRVIAELQRDAALTARAMAPDALMEWADVLTADLADDDPEFPGDVGRFLAAIRLHAVKAELLRHERLSRLDRGVASPMDHRFQAWRDLAALVRERVTPADVLLQFGWSLVSAGWCQRRGCVEYCGPCPVCGYGTDRLRVWDQPNGRVWCRQCGWSADVIAITQSIRQCSFREAVTWLANLAGVSA